MADQSPTSKLMLPPMAAGQRYGRLVAVVFDSYYPDKHSNGGRRTQWRFHCDCGTDCVIKTSYVRSSNTTSCGCVQKQMLAAGARRRFTTHGMTDSPEWSSWKAMIERCTCPTHQAFQNYGGRGILVCERWLGSFDAFYADMGPRPKGTSLDRINNDRGYEPGNVRWATRKEQERNKKNNLLVTFKGRTMALSEACELARMKYREVHRRITRYGWNVDEALSTPIRILRKQV